MTAWKFVTNFAIPPALVLTILLILPTPQVVRKGLLIFTRRVLFLNVIGNFKLVHAMMILTAASFTACSVQTYHMNTAIKDDMLTPNQRMGMLAKKWREERNFWIATLAFLLWAFLYRFYALMIDYVNQRDRSQVLELRLARMHQQLAEAGAHAPLKQEPSAPMVMAGSPDTLNNRGRKKEM